MFQRIGWGIKSRLGKVGVATVLWGVYQGLDLWSNLDFAANSIDWGTIGSAAVSLTAWLSSSAGTGVLISAGLAMVAWAAYSAQPPGTEASPLEVEIPWAEATLLAGADKKDVSKRLGEFASTLVVNLRLAVQNPFTPGVQIERLSPALLGGGVGNRPVPLAAEPFWICRQDGEENFRLRGDAHAMYRVEALDQAMFEINACWYLDRRVVDTFTAKHHVCITVLVAGFDPPSEAQVTFPWVEVRKLIEAPAGGIPLPTTQKLIRRIVDR